MFPSNHVMFCLFYNLYVLQHILWLVNHISFMVFDLAWFKHDFSQWLKTLYNGYSTRQWSVFPLYGRGIYILLFQLFQIAKTKPMMRSNFFLYKLFKQFRIYVGAQSCCWGYLWYSPPHYSVARVKITCAQPLLYQAFQLCWLRTR